MKFLTWATSADLAKRGMLANITMARSSVWTGLPRSSPRSTRGSSKPARLPRRAAYPYDRPYMSAVGEARDRIGELVIASINSSGRRGRPRQGRPRTWSPRSTSCSRTPASSASKVPCSSGPGAAPRAFFDRHGRSARVKKGFVERNLRILFPLPAIAFVARDDRVPRALHPVPEPDQLEPDLGEPRLRSWRLRSYARVLGEPRFLAALGRTFLFTVIAVAAETVLGTAAALILNQKFVGKATGEAAAPAAARGHAGGHRARLEPLLRSRPSGWPTTSSSWWA